MAGPGRIPWTAIDAYARRHGFEGPAFLRFEYLLQKMDTAYLRTLKRKRPSGEGVK